MPATNSGQDSISSPGWDQRYRVIAKQVFEQVVAARPAPDGFNPDQAEPNGISDIPRPSGAYTAALIAPGEWPEVSESAVMSYSKAVAKWARDHAEADQIATGQAGRVFDGDWTEGEGREAAQRHYRALHLAHEDLVDLAKDVAARSDRLGKDIHTAKRKMRNAHDAAHREIEQALMTNRGQPVGVGPIIAKYRPHIEVASTQLLGYGQQETAGLTRQFGPPPEAPPSTGDPAAPRIRQPRRRWRDQAGRDVPVRHPRG